MLIAWFVLAVVVFIALFYITAPYGRHTRKGWGPVIGSKSGWLIMESVPPIAFIFLFVFGSNPITMPALVFVGLWEAHYIHRGFVYPFTRKGQGRQIPFLIVVFGLVFNAGNSYLNGRHIFTFSGDCHFIS